MKRPFFSLATALFAVGGLAGCGGSANTFTSSGGLPELGSIERRAQSQQKIQHVIIIVQENRSVDNLFQGYPKADVRDYGFNSAGKKVKLVPVGLEANWDIDHSLASFLAACNGKGSLPGTDCQMNGFDRETDSCLHNPTCPPTPQYAYVPQSETKPYFAMAHQYVLADHMFTSMIDASSFTSHQYIIAGESQSSYDFPSTPQWGCDGGKDATVPTLTQQRTTGPSIRPCFPSATLGDELDAAGLSWGYYTASINGDGDNWNAYQAIKHIRYGPDWHKNVHWPATRFYNAVKSDELPAVTWITPTCRNSDHASCGSNHGPHWVASLVNTIGESKYWKSSAIFVFWDEYGGWYDHVAPKMVDYDGLGLRVPLLVISPYAKKGYVSHVDYEHGSLLKFVEDQFGLPRLAESDTRATSPADDCFDFTQKPRAFTPIPDTLNRAYFENEPNDGRVPDNE
ncbi:MAG TPA: alkaline phosphatase family protein [Candidatus Tumulicola sp.]